MEKSIAAVTRCFFCNKPKNELLLAKSFRRNAKGEVVPSVDLDKIHNKVVDKVPCDEGKEALKMGIVLVSVREPKSIEDSENPFRTGGWVVIKETAWERMNEHNKNYDPKQRFCFITDETWLMMGLPLSEYQKSYLK